MITDKRKKKVTYLLPFILLIFLSGFARAEEVPGPMNNPSLNIQDMDIKTLLKVLAIKNNLNIISTPEVTGRISLHLSNADLEDTLTAITKTMGLNWRKEGTVYIVEKGKNKNEKDVTIKIFPINYADLTELTAMVQWSFKDARTTAYSKERLLLVESEEKIFPKIENLISSIDIPPKQALIETRILEITLNDDTLYGFDWGDSFDGKTDRGQVNTPGPQFTSENMVNDPSQFFFGITKPSFYLKLSALEKTGDVKTLATPRLLVLDGKSAQILIGGKIGYYQTTTTETSTLQSVEFVDVGTQLELTPHIANDGTIILTIHPEVSTGGLEGGIPQKNTTSVTTSIMVKSGETIFIGGLIRNSEIENIARFPILGSIPIIGPIFFSNYSKQTKKKELVILLTPHIISASSSGQTPNKVGNLQNEMKQWQEKIEEMEKQAKTEKND